MDENESFDKQELKPVLQDVDGVWGFKTCGGAGVMFNERSGGKVGVRCTVETLGNWWGNSNFCKRLITAG